MPIIDSHCHYNLEPLLSEWEHHWRAAQEKGIESSVVVGTSVTSSRDALKIATADPNMWAAVGVHPSEYSSHNPDVTTAEKSFVSDETIVEWHKDLTTMLPHPRVVAIGETGLDYFFEPDDVEVRRINAEKQRQGFIFQLKLAAQHNLPTIIHVRDKGEQAYWDTIEILKENLQPNQVFILHCVSGPLEYIKAAVELGGYIGVAGNVTYKSADHIRSLVRTTPIERILLETDAPFLPPVPHRGQPCDPWMISLTAEFLVDELGLDLDTIRANTLRVFGLHKN